MNSEQEWNQIQELKSELKNVRKREKKASDELVAFLTRKHQLSEQICLEYDLEGNATAIAKVDGQERRLFMPLAKSMESRYLVCYGLDLEAEGICLDDIEEWFVKENTVYCWVKNAIMPVPAGLAHKAGNEFDKFFIAGRSLAYERPMCLCYAALPCLFPELGIEETEQQLSERCKELSVLAWKMQQEVDARLHSFYQARLQKMVDAIAQRIDLKKTTMQQIKEEVLALLKYRNAGQVARWAKRHHLIGINLRRKAHWMLVLETVKLDSRTH